MIHYSKKLLIGVGILILLLALSACGAKQEETTTPAISQTPAESAAIENPSAAPSESAEGVQEERVVATELGDLKLPQQVEKVVTLERSLADHLVALGVAPIGAVVRDGGDFEPYISESLKGTESVGQSGAPNLEKILELKPQLIIGTDKDHSKSYDVLSEIAPSLIISSKEMEKDWREVFRTIATAMNKEELAEQQLQQFQNRIDELKKELEPVLKDKTVVFFKVTDKDTRILGNLSPLGKIAYGELGLVYPSELEDEKNETKIAAEKLPEINPDYIFVMDINVPDYAPKLDEMLQTPLWKNLNAVKNDHVFMVPLRATKTGFGLVMHNQFLDIIKQGLVE